MHRCVPRQRTSWSMLVVAIAGFNRGGLRYDIYVVRRTCTRCDVQCSLGVARLLESRRIAGTSVHAAQGCGGDAERRARWPTHGACVWWPLQRRPRPRRSPSTAALSSSHLSSSRLSVPLSTMMSRPATRENRVTRDCARATTTRRPTRAIESESETETERRRVVVLVPASAWRG